MEWYWWALLVVAFVVAGYIKLKVLGQWMVKRKKDVKDTLEEE